MNIAPTGDPPFLVRVAGSGGIGLGKEPPADGASSLRFWSLPEAPRPPPSHLLRQDGAVVNVPWKCSCKWRPCWIASCFHDDLSGFSVGGDNTGGAGRDKTSHRKPTQPLAAAGDEALSGTIVEAKVYRCTLCFRTFPSGQALGRHKRLHYDDGAVKDTQAVTVKTKAVVATTAVRKYIDLNPPAAATGDEAESSPSEAKRARMLRGPNPRLWRRLFLHLAV
ncbi:hypothetical protein GUJ93_ZPchr0007g5909 [Zizania palustris]|uniref:C2H2-type domain-containing protein n=1 Tax=Zizania palustris TaxID=103762 RepID=A0A8J5VZ20_ZIZPA|nr:hypothetical protein GUJ93_ZPchr0007g5909 [Zizania palustris]